MFLDEARLYLHVDLADLEPAPAQPSQRDQLARTGLDPKPCSACGQPARTSGVIRDPHYGPRWLDRCRDCFIATPPLLQVSLKQAIADLRETAAEMGTKLTILTDDSRK